MTPTCWTCGQDLDSSLDRSINGQAAVHACGECASPRFVAMRARQRWYQDAVQAREQQRQRRVALLELVSMS